MVPIPLSQERLIPAPRVAVVGEVMLAHGQGQSRRQGFAGSLAFIPCGYFVLSSWNSILRGMRRLIVTKDVTEEDSC